MSARFEKKNIIVNIKHSCGRLRSQHFFHLRRLLLPSALLHRTNQRSNAKDVSGFCCLQQVLITFVSDVSANRGHLTELTFEKIEVWATNLFPNRSRTIKTSFIDTRLVGIMIYHRDSSRELHAVVTFRHVCITIKLLYQGKSTWRHPLNKPPRTLLARKVT